VESVNGLTFPLPVNIVLDKKMLSRETPFPHACQSNR